MSITSLEPAAPTVNGAQAVPFAAVPREHMRWLLPGLVPLGMLTLLLGDPGLGKSLWTCWLAARASRAGGAVLLSSAEDSPGATVRPRLEATQADLDLVHMLEVRREGIAEGLSLPDDVPALDGLVGEHHARHVVLDPLAAHLGEAVNSWRDQSVRRALAPLAHMAAEHGCAVIVVAHLNKGAGGEPLYRAGGSIGVPAAARSALLLARDPDDPDGERGSARILAHVKSNVSLLAESQSCAVEPVLLPGDERIATARITITGTSQVTGSELLRVEQPEQRTERDEATELLRDLLTEPTPAKEIKTAAADAGIAWRTIERAKVTLGVEVRRESAPASSRGRGRWVWRLPDQYRHDQDRLPYPHPVAVLDKPHQQAKNETPTDQDRHATEMAVLSPNGHADADAEMARIAAKFTPEAIG